MDATTGDDLWAERFDRPLRDIFAVQAEIVQKIVTTVGLVFKLKENGFPALGATNHGTNNLEAYRRSSPRDLLRLEHDWEAGNANARAMCERAIEPDSKYGRICWCWVDQLLGAWAGWVESSKAVPHEKLIRTLLSLKREPWIAHPKCEKGYRLWMALYLALISAAEPN